MEDVTDRQHIVYTRARGMDDERGEAIVQAQSTVGLLFPPSKPEARI
jgi:TRAP-type C4-dicarboxylate transport system permease large subunit